MLRCIFHADDCGLTPQVTRGILEAVDKGRLQSTSVMAGGLHADAALAAMRARPETFAVTHLNLLEGKACADPALVPDLADAEGFFRLSLCTLLIGLFNGGKKAKALREQIFIEFCAQIDAVRQGTGREKVRLDGHLHVHVIPSLLPVMEKIMRKYPVEYLRIPFESRYLPRLPASRMVPGVLCRELLAFWSPPLRRLALQLGVPVPDYFVGAYASGSMSLVALRQGLERAGRCAAKAGKHGALAEVMFHPGHIGVGGDAQAAWYGRSAYAGAHDRPEREAELALLLSDGFMDMISELGLATLSP